MARAVGIDFKFTGDSTKAVAAFRQVAAAAKASGGDIGAAGRQIESALNSRGRRSEAAAVVAGGVGWWHPVEGCPVLAGVD